MVFYYRRSLGVRSLYHAYWNPSIHYYDYRKKKNPIECYSCGLLDSLPFTCNYCKEYFCSDHRNPLHHSCPFLYSYNKRIQGTLFNDQPYNNPVYQVY